jgi:hypothetical protein
MEKVEKKVKETKDPKVTVFGENLSEGEEKNCCFGQGRRDGGSLIFGFLMVLAGIIFLFNTLGVLPWSVWSIVGRLWPVVLILIGVDIIFGHSWVSHVFTFILTLGTGLIVLGLIFLNFSPQVLEFLPVGVIDFLKVLGSSLQLR